MRKMIGSSMVLGLCLAAAPAGAQTFDRTTCPPDLSNYGGCAVRVYVAPVRPPGFHEQAFGIVRKGYDPGPDAPPPVKAKRNTGPSPR
jgi:hypothetical protein